MVVVEGQGAFAPSQEPVLLASVVIVQPEAAQHAPVGSQGCSLQARDSLSGPQGAPPNCAWTSTVRVRVRCSRYSGLTGTLPPPPGASMTNCGTP